MIKTGLQVAPGWDAVIRSRPGRAPGRGDTHSTSFGISVKHDRVDLFSVDLGRPAEASGGAEAADGQVGLHVGGAADGAARRHQGAQHTPGRVCAASSLC